MIHQFLVRLGLRQPNAAQLLHRELSAIELTLVLRCQEILNLYNEMDQLRVNHDEVRLKLEQWQAKPLKSFQLAR